MSLHYQLLPSLEAIVTGMADSMLTSVSFPIITKCHGKLTYAETTIRKEMILSLKAITYPQCGIH